MPTFDTVYAFLKKHYKPARFEGRGKGYAERLTRSVMSELARLGYSLVSHHDSISGRAVWFNANLNEIPPGQVRSLLRNQGKPKQRM